MTWGTYEQERGTTIQSDPERNRMVKWIVLGVIGLLGFIGALMWIAPSYSVWHQHMVGKAELARAEYSKQVAVQEATAKKNSASLLAERDTIQAHGQARANAILAHSLSGPDGKAYLQYLWIQGLGEGGRTPTVVYVPTETGLPILEAGREARR